MRVPFNDLRPPVRERFVQITKAPGLDPRVLASSTSWAGIWVAYVLGGLSLVALVPILQFTFTRGQTIDPYHDREV